MKRDKYMGLGRGSPFFGQKIPDLKVDRCH